MARALRPRKPVAAAVLLLGSPWLLAFALRLANARWEAAEGATIILSPLAYLLALGPAYRMASRKSWSLLRFLPLSIAIWLYWCAVAALSSTDPKGFVVMSLALAMMGVVTLPFIPFVKGLADRD